MKSHSYYTSILVAFSLARALSAPAGTNDWGAVTNGAQMSISLKEGENGIKIHQPVVVKIRLRNLSVDETFHFNLAKENGQSWPFRFQVISPSGEQSANASEAYGRGRFVDVSPKQTKEFEFDLSRTCKFDQAGTYQVIAKLTVDYNWAVKAEALKGAEVVSNPVYVSVLSGD
jgi:hypothetical protein